MAEDLMVTGRIGFGQLMVAVLDGIFDGLKMFVLRVLHGFL